MRQTVSYPLACLTLSILTTACGSGPAASVGDGGTPADTAASCSADSQCDDGLYCDGAERCDPSDPAADARGCVEAAAPACEAGRVCDERADRCELDTCAEPDADGDGHERVACGGDDCDDADAARFPGNPELCDATGHDEDCDPDTLGPDLDGDGFAATRCCNGALCGLDCDDSSAEINPEAPESCNAVDDDCDAEVDETVASAFYQDCDGDGFGRAGASATYACALPADAPAACGGLPTAGWSEDARDCDDESGARSPAVTESCNGVDDDCDGMLDGPGEDDDADGYADLICGGDDCDDTDASAHPGAAELCDGIDSDCDGESEDQDGDGYAASAAMCSGGPLPRTDCDDTRAHASPATVGDWCNGVDGNCSGDESDCDAIIDVHVGRNHTCALFASGGAWCWGAGARGQLGDGMGLDSSVPVEVSGLSEGVALVGGANHTCALLSDGGLACWGDETSAVLGGAGRRLVAQRLTAVPALTHVASGLEAICGIRADRRVVCWGAATTLGDRTTYTSASATPIVIGGVDDAVDIAMGRSHACVARADGRVTCWGSAIERQLGNGSSSTPPLPVDAIGIDDAVAVFGPSLDDNTCARRASGEIWCWGANARFQLGLAPGGTPGLPTRSAFFGTDEPVLGRSYACTTRASGVAECRGQGRYGELGQGADTFEVTTPVSPLGIGSVALVAAGDATTCWLTTAQGLRCSGINEFGAAGDGSTGLRLEPTFVVAP